MLKETVEKNQLMILAKEKKKKELKDSYQDKVERTLKEVKKD